MTKKKLYIKALNLEPSFGPTYIHLGALLQRGEYIVIESPPHLIYNKLKILIQAVQLNPQDPLAHVYLGMECNRTIPLPIKANAKPMNNIDLYIHAIELNPNLPLAWQELGKTLNAGERVLVNGSLLTQQQIYQRATELVQRNEFVYPNLVNTFQPDEISHYLTNY